MWSKNSLILCFLFHVFLFALACCAFEASAAGVGAFRYHEIMVEKGAVPVMNVIGFTQSHVIKKNETLLDVARNYGLGYNEVVLAHPELDPWVPEKGAKIKIPSSWALPPARYESVVINIPEMRLYRFFTEQNLVKTYPIGIGRQGFNTPITDTKVAVLIRNPDWTVPPAMRKKVGRAIVPPGPANPLGGYWIGLAAGHIGIHGTNFPWGIGRRVSHGCLRMYPEHIKYFFSEVKVGTRVEILYEPVKIGIRHNKIFLEIHPDIHGMIPNMYRQAESLLKERAVWTRVDPEKVRRAVAAQSGRPVPVGILKTP